MFEKRLNINNRKRKPIKHDRNKIDKIIPGKFFPPRVSSEREIFNIKTASHFV